MKQKIFCIVPAAGAGSRFGKETPKLLFPIHKRPAIEWTAKALISSKVFEKIIFAIPPRSLQSSTHQFDFLKELSPSIDLVQGGAERIESVLRGYDSCEASDDDIILVHDGARPCINKELIDRIIGGVREHGAVTLASKILDTVKRVSDDVVKETLNRNELVTVQTPQGFISRVLREAFKSKKENMVYTDEASLVEQVHPVHVIFSKELNPKLTTVEDIWILEKLLK